MTNTGYVNGPSDGPRRIFGRENVNWQQQSASEGFSDLTGKVNEARGDFAEQSDIDRAESLEEIRAAIDFNVSYEPYLRMGESARYIVEEANSRHGDEIVEIMSHDSVLC